MLFCRNLAYYFQKRRKAEFLVGAFQLNFKYCFIPKRERVKLKIFAAAAGSRYAKIQALVGAKAMARVAIDVLHEKTVRENPANEREAAWRQAFGG